MKKTLQIIGIIATLAILFNGCASKPKVPISYYKPTKATTVVKNDNIAYVSNGALVFNNGKKLYDEDGDIVETFTVNEKVYYLLNIQNKNLYILKDQDRKIIKTIKATSIFLFTDINKAIIAIKLAGNKSNIYDNIYEFKNEKLNLVNKNVPLGSSTIAGLSYIKTYVRGGYFRGYKIKNIIDSKEITIVPKKSSGRDYYIIGVIGEKILYTYYNVNYDAVLEIYDIKNNTYHTILDEKTRFQILRAGNQYVLKIFDNKKIFSESKMHGHFKYLKSKYDNKPAKYLSLNSLQEVQISTEFKPVLFYSGFGNLGGGYTKETYITLNGYKLHSILEKKKGRPAF